MGLLGMSRLWVQVDAFSGGTPSQPLTAEVRVDGQRRFRGRFNASRFPRRYSWASIAISPELDVRPGQNVEVILSAPQRRWSIRSFDEGKWFSKTDRRAGPGSASAVRAALQNGRAGRYFESSNGGSTWALRSNLLIPVALED